MTEEKHPADKAKEEVLDEMMFTVAFDSRTGMKVANAMAKKWKDSEP